MMSCPSNPIKAKETFMSDKIPPPPLIYEGLDPPLEEKSVIGEVADAIKGTAQTVGDMVDSGRKPGDAARRVEQHRSRSAAGIAPDRILAGCRSRQAKIAEDQGAEGAFDTCALHRFYKRKSND
jgi:hypothetical protein